MINPNDMAAKVIGYSGGASIKRRFGIDTKTYAWVKDFVRDKEARDRISLLQEKIAQFKASLIHKDELKEMFKTRVKKINEFRIEQLKDHLAKVQKREERLMDELYMDNRLVIGARPYPFLMAFSAADLEEIFSKLPDGVKQKDTDQTVLQHQEEIQKIEGFLAKELSPQNRWFHGENGNPRPYPHGCRWTPFVETWRKVNSRFAGPVDIEGYGLKTEAEHAAYLLLGLIKEKKLPPLRKPF